MSVYAERPSRSPGALLSSSFAYCPGARFTGLLSPEFFVSTVGLTFTLGWGCTWDFTFTLWTWLDQALSADKSCSTAVARAMAICCCLGRPICSALTGAFCKARAKIAVCVLCRLATTLAKHIHEKAERAW